MLNLKRARKLNFMSLFWSYSSTVCQMKGDLPLKTIIKKESAEGLTFGKNIIFLRHRRISFTEKLFCLIPTR